MQGRLLCCKKQQQKNKTTFHVEIVSLFPKEAKFVNMGKIKQVHRMKPPGVCTVGEEDVFRYPEGSSGWSNNQVDLRQSSKRKSAH